MDVSAYLNRIAYQGPLAVSPATLRDLHRAHMLSVPFENLDIPLGRKIVCHEESILDKIVNRRRGGFCYEANGAFAALLRELGFKVTMLSARVPREDGSECPDFDHLALRVDLEEPWLSDVGFGDSFLEPLRLKPGLEQTQGRRKFRILEEDNSSLRVEMAEPGEPWKREYSFTLTPRKFADFADMCAYHQTSAESPFTRRRVCSIATKHGRITLADSKLIITRDGRKEESSITSEKQWHASLKRHFGIVL
jgi:N-hydroxyarylamine O-acetyltransferase